MTKSQNEPAPRRTNPLFRYIGRRVSCAFFLIVFIVGTFGACAIFAPAFFQQTIRIAQSAGLKAYTLILGATGNPALKLTTYEVTITAQSQISRDMGLLGALYGEGIQIEGQMRVSLGADLKNNQFGVLACDIDDRTIRTIESHSPLSQFAFDKNSIRQEAYVAFKQQAAATALNQYWSEAKKRLESQFVNWAVGITPPDQPTLKDCPNNLATTSSAPSPTP